MSTTTNRITAISGQELGRINYDISLNVPDGRTLSVSLVQYVALSQDSLFILTCTTTTDQLDQYAHLFEEIAQGLYIL